MAKPIGQLSIVIGANTKAFEKSITSMERQISRDIGRIQKRAEGMGDGFQKSFAKAQLSFKKFQLTVTKGAQSVLAVLGKVGAAIATAFAIPAAAATAFTTAAAGIDRVAKSADRLGVSIKTFQSLQLAADRAGVGLDVLIDSARQFNTNLFSGSKSFTDALAKTGLSIENLLKLNPEQRLLKVAESIGKIEDASQRAFVATKLYGESGRDLVLITADAIRQAQEDTERLGLALGEDMAAQIQVANDAVGTWQRIGSAAMDQVLGAIAPLVTTIAQMGLGFVEAGGGAEAFGDIATQVVRGVAVGIDVVLDQLLRMKLALQAIASFVTDVYNRAKPLIEIQQAFVTGGVSGILRGAGVNPASAVGSVADFASGLLNSGAQSGFIESFDQNASLPSAPNIQTGGSNFTPSETASQKTNRLLESIANKREKQNERVAKDQQRWQDQLAKSAEADEKKMAKLELDNRNILQDRELEHLETVARIRTEIADIEGKAMVNAATGMRREALQTVETLKAALRAIGLDGFIATNQSASALQKIAAMAAETVTIGARPGMAGTPAMQIPGTSTTTGGGGGSGSVVGVVGSTGVGSGPHIHAQIRGGGRPLSNAELNYFTVNGRPISDYVETSGYGPRNTGIPGASRNHRGRDFGAPSGAPIVATGGARATDRPSSNKGGAGIITSAVLPNGTIIDFFHNDPKIYDLFKSGGGGSGKTVVTPGMTIPGTPAIPADPGKQVARYAPETIKALKQFETDEAGMGSELRRMQGQSLIDTLLADQTNAWAANTEAMGDNLEILQARLDGGVEAEEQARREIEARNLFQQQETVINELLKGKLITQEQATSQLAELLRLGDELAAQQQQEIDLKNQIAADDDFNNRYESLSQQLADATNQYNLMLAGRTELNTAEQVALDITRSGIELSEEYTNKLIAQAQAIDTQLEKNEALTQQLQLIDEISQTFEGAFSDAFASVITGAESFEDAMKGLLDNIFKQLLQITLNLALSSIFGGSGGGGIFGGLFGGLLGSRHTGGEVKKTGQYSLLRGERVLSSQQAQSMGTTVNVNNYAGVDVETRSNGDGSTDIIIQQAVSESRKAVQSDFSRSVASGYGKYSQSLSRGYAINRRL